MIDETEILSEFPQQKTNNQSGIVNARALKPGTLLNSQYSVISIIGEGGFGITYKAFDKYLKINVAIKEYFPAQFASRNTISGSDTISTIDGERIDLFYQGLNDYAFEANRLTKFNSLEGIVSVLNFFYANNTAYMVMEYIDGISLKQFLEKNKGTISWRTVLDMLNPVIKSLQIIHDAGIIHRDISPDNIMIDDKGKVTIIDFGSARYFDDEKSKTIMLKRGYAPPEQYMRNGKQGPWTDIYSLCATMYYMITGVRLPESLSIKAGIAKINPISKVVEGVPDYISNTIYRGLEFEVSDRIQSAKELEKYLYNEKTAPKIRSNAKKNRFIALSFIVGVTVAVIIAVVIARAQSSNNSKNIKSKMNSENDAKDIINNLMPESNMIPNSDDKLVDEESGEKSSYIPARFTEVDANSADDFTYYVTSEGVVIDGIKPNVTQCRIPSEIDGKRVVSIEKTGANITDMFIPEGVEKIGDSAFKNCVYLEYIYIPSSVQFISKNAFTNCLSLKTIEISPENENYYFDGNNLKDKEGNTIF